jgi:hypothetical protein
MTTSELTPMSEEEIREFLADEQFAHSEGTGKAIDCRICAFILAWIHERAMKEKAEFWRFHDEHDPESCLECDSRLTVDEIDFSYYHDRTDAGWITAVKARVGWADR